MSTEDAERVLRPFLDAVDQSSWGSQGSSYENDLEVALAKALELLGVTE